jgi:two-component system, chemotaxis family, chemotaxis protein CheY
MGAPVLLIADDSYYVRYAVRRALRGVRFAEILETESGDECLRIYLQRRPALVLLDLVMHGLSGLDALKAILRADATARVIVVSAVDAPDLLRECIEAGVTDFVVKPFEDQDLRRAALAALAMRSRSESQG